ncbi:MAG: aminomethyltransferase beta-barrel domain-containing protein, partial [bacterium]
GVIVDKEGKVLANHKGYPYFTIGQRKGLGISGERRYYVKEIIPITREVIVAPEEDLWCSEFIITDCNYLIKPCNTGSSLWVKVRYRDRGTPIKALYETSEGIVIKLHQPAFAVTPGQSAVVYQGDEVLLGGIIKRAL